MNEPRHIGMFMGMFPVVSETFILRQITGLIDLGKKVTVFADVRGDCISNVQPEVLRYGLLKEAVWTDAPPESTPYEMSVFPLNDETWLPGAPEATSNAGRLLRALPQLIHCFGLQPSLTSTLLDPGEHSYRASSLSGIYRLARLLRHNQPCDVIHAHFGPTANSFRFVRPLWNAPMVVSFHGYDFTTVPQKEGKNVYQRLFREVDMVTVNSRFTQGCLEALGCPTERMRMRPVGVDLEQFPFKARLHRKGEPLNVLAVGRLVEKKGHEYLIRAVARVRERLPEVRCHIAGGGPLQTKLRNLVAELGLVDSVTLHGALPGPAVQKLFAEAHVFVLPSVTAGDAEGQGLVLQEAQAVGLPVIATQHGPLPEGLLVEESGFLVPERDADALAERIHFLAAHADQWPRMGQSGRGFVEARYDIKKLNRRLLEIYSEAREAYRSGVRPARSEI